MSTDPALRDRMEEVGLLELMVAVCTFFAKPPNDTRSVVTKSVMSICSCRVPHGVYQDSAFYGPFPHDVGCAVMKLLLIFGTPEHHEQMRSEAHDHARVALDVVAEPNHRSYRDVAYARWLVGRPLESGRPE